MSKTVILASDGISLSDTKTLEETVSSHSTSISNNATAIALKANSSDVYTKTETDGLISTEVSNRNSAIEQSASQIQLSVSETYSTKAETKMTNEAEGNIIQVDDAMAAPAIEFDVYGASTQVTTTGKNLFDSFDVVSGTYINSAGQRATGNSNTSTNFIPIIGGGQYAFSYGAALSGGNYIAWYTDTDESTVTGSRVDARGLASIVATAPSNANYVRFSFQTSTLSSIQLEQNSTATSYEPYTGSKPSPSPDYPQEIANVDNLVGWVSGKNMLDINEWELDTNSGITINDDGVSFRVAQQPYQELKNRYYIPTLYSCVISFDYEVVETFGNTTAACFMQCHDGSTILSSARMTVVTIGEIKHVELSIPESAKAGRYLAFGGWAYSGVIRVYNIQLELGSTATTYEPYVGHAAPLLPDGYSLRSLPDGTKDELHLAYLKPSTRDGWAWYSRDVTAYTGLVTLDGTENWNVGGASYNGNVGTDRYVNVAGMRNTGNGLTDNDSLLSNKVLHTGNFIWSNPDVHVWKCVKFNGQVHIVFDNATVGITSETSDRTTLIKTWLSENPITVQYPLAAPVAIALDPIELPILHSPMCTVYATADATPGLHMKYWTIAAEGIVEPLLISDSDSEAQLSAISSRVSTAESNITQNADNIATKVSKDGVISSINQSAETIKIQASKVEIDGTAIFTNSDFQTQLNNQGYATTTQVATAKQEAIDSIEVGGRNLLLSTPASYNQNNYLTYQVPTTFALNELSVGDSITIQFWGVEVDDNYSGIGVYWNSGGLMLGSNTVKADANGYWKYTFKVTQQQLNNSASSGKKLFIYNMTNGHANSSLKIAKWKLEKGTVATDWTPAPEDVDASISAVDSSLESYKSTTNTTLTSLQNQVDGQIEAWYKSVDPTGSNEPASIWTTDALKARHIGDLYYNVTNGHSWRWMQSGDTYEWQQIPDSDAAAALAVAQDAQTTANSKRRIFTTTPTVPYDVGDLWVDGSSVKYCSNMKTDSGTYSENDWTTTATDDTGVSALQQQLITQLGTTGAPYQEVEWIESNGKQFIYLDWKPVAETFGFEADFIIRNVFSTSAGAWNAITNINGFGNVFGVRNSSMTNDFQLGSYNTNGLIRLGNKDTYAYITRNTRQTCSLIGNVYTDPTGTARTITRGTTVSDKPYHNMSIFAMYEGSTRRATVGNLVQPGSVRIYSLKFYENTTVAVNLTPAVRLSDNVAGLWDSVSNHFYPARGAAVGEKIANHYFGEIYSITKTIEITNPSLITTNTSASRLWTADAPMLDSLVDGQQITITPIYNSVATTRPEELSEWDESTTTAVGNVYIKLTLANNETTEWIPVYYSANARLTTHYVSGAPITLTYHENMLVNVADTGGSSVVRGWFQQPDYNTNTTYNLGQNIHGTAITAKEAITRYHLIMGDALGYQNVVAGNTFDISYPLLLAYAAAIAATKTSTGTYETYPAADFSYNGTIEAGAANKMLYLKGTISGNTFTVAASPFMTTVVPDEADGYLYIPLGIMSSVKLANFVSSKDLYAYLDGEFRQVTPTEIVSTHRIYYRTATANSSLAAPTTWIEEATGNVYNQWTTKVPPLAASTASGQTKYLYLYTCEQRKRLDGTTVCTKVLLDENMTVIDGGSIITNSVTANQIAAGTITAAEIEAGTITATQIASSAITTDKLDASAVTADKIAANAITTAKLDAGAVTAAKIDSGAITTDKLDANAVTAAKIASSAITTDKLDANAVTTAKLDAGAVTAAKIDSGAITTDKLDAGAVTAAKIASSAITTDKLDANAVTAAKIDATDLHVRAANIDGTIGFGQLSGVQASGNYALTSDLTTEINQRKAQYGTCSTAAGTTPKAVTCANFELVEGNEITVKFSTANTSSGKIQLNVNSTGNKDVWVGNAVTSATNMLLWGANAYITFKYDGTQFQVIGEPRTWYGECSVAEATAAKTSTITGCVICKGTKVELAMTYANSAASPTLNISSTGAKNLYFGTGTTRPTISGGTSWLAANTATFTFDGATWRTQGKTYIDANSITTGYISADRIQGGSLSIGMFNNSTQADILNSNVTVPQKVSDLTNDTGFITSSSLPTKVSDLNNDSYFATQTEAQGYATTAANGKDSAIAAAAKTATNYITADSTGIKIASSDPSQATTYQHQTATNTEYYINSEKLADIGGNGITLGRTTTAPYSHLELTGSSMKFRQPSFVNIPSDFEFNANSAYPPDPFNPGPSGNHTGWIIGPKTKLNRDFVQITPTSFSAGDPSRSTDDSATLLAGIDTVRIGKAFTSNIKLDYHSLQLIDKEGDSYFHISDLRDETGKAELTENFNCNGVTTSFSVSTDVSDEVSVSFVPDQTIAYTRSGKIYNFSSAPSAGAILTITYKTTDRIKAYTLGTRTGDIGPYSYAFGIYNQSSGMYSQAFGYRNRATGLASHAEGGPLDWSTHITGTTASGQTSHAEGAQTIASGTSSHAEGFRTKASGICSHAEGGGYNYSDEYNNETIVGSIASGYCSHAEGNTTIASGKDSHAEGRDSTASGEDSHAEGLGSTASGVYSHAEGRDSTASGWGSHAQNNQTIAASSSQTALGKLNIQDNNNTYAVIIGNGTSPSSRSNALTIDWDGNTWLAGGTTLNGVLDIYGSSSQKANTPGDAPSENEYHGSIQSFDSTGDRDFYSMTAHTSTDVLYRSFVLKRDINNTSVSNGFYLRINDDGTEEVTFTNGADSAWRTGLGLGSLATKNSLEVSDIPSLAASKINSGTFDTARIPSLAASKINSGTFDAARIPDNMSASKIESTSPTSVTLNSATKAYSSGMTPKYRKWGNVVNVYGAVSPKSEVAAGGSLTIGSLPSGYRPSLDSTWLCQGSGNAVWALSIDSNGSMTASRYRSGASVNAAIPTNAWLIFNVTYIVS